MVTLKWEDEELNRRDSTGTTADSFGDHSGDLQQGYPLGSLTDGLVAYYPFDGDVQDYALDNDGTDNTSAGYVSGQVGSDAKGFDGNDDWVKLPAGKFNWIDGNRFTVSFWFRLNDDTSAQDFISFRADQNVSIRFNKSGNSKVDFATNDGGNVVKSFTNTSFSANNWNHVTFVYYPTGVVRTYVNGQFDIEDTSQNTSFQNLDLVSAVELGITVKNILTAK
jgi:hypothetical protein